MGSSFDRRFGFCLSVLAPFLARASASIDPHFSGASHGTDFIYNQAFQLDLSSSSSPDTMETIETYTDTGKHSFQDGCIPHTRPHPVVRSDVVYKSEMSSANTNNINDDNYNNDSSSLWILGERDTLPLFQIDSEAPNNNVRPQNVIYQVNLLNGDKRVNSNDEEEEEENDDEDNDDDNDGHSSMLSNASLRFRKSLVFASPLPNGLSSSASIQSVLSRLRGGGTNSPITDSAQSLIHTVLSSEICKRLIVTAVVTLLFEASMGHIFEFLKIVLQTAEHETTYMQEIRKITAAKGLVGLWDGFCPWGIVQAVSKGAVFGLAHSSAMQVLVPLAEKGVLPMPVALALAGGVGGGLQGYVLSPTLLLKTRVMTVREMRYIFIAFYLSTMEILQYRSPRFYSERRISRENVSVADYIP